MYGQNSIWPKHNYHLIQFSMLWFKQRLRKPHFPEISLLEEKSATQVTKSSRSKLEITPTDLPPPEGKGETKRELLAVTGEIGGKWTG